jgi:hypothetical protein
MKENYSYGLLCRISYNYLANGMTSRKTYHMKSVFWVSLQRLSETFLNQRRVRGVIINLPRSSCKVPATFFSDFNQIFYTSLNKNLQCKVSRKPVQREPSCSIRTDKQTDGKTCRQITKRTIAFRNFANSSKNWPFQCSLLQESLTYFC